MNEALIKKLRLSSDGKIAIMEPPQGFLELVGRTEQDTQALENENGTYDFVQLFVTSVADVERLAPQALRAVKPDGLLWICYPKGSSKIKTDLNRDRGWSIVSASGWEGIAIVSVDDTWSALRFRPASAVGKTRVPPAERSAASAGQTEPLEIPQDLQAAVDANAEATAFFGNLAPSHKKEYVRWIVEAKREETRVSRIEKAIEKLSGGFKRPSDK
ncbi:YdeI/OmpD-associated family protein [Cohnella luojiensis]|uniref:YdeI/OmpD-associated family protein n=1 Tax=Cohnella luojiensis TaxID=652876 RepID=A0A4Y8M7M8_9BACL|nr:YdeI/OmpD-associated family protein [Cohnella luojiensis]TFE30739.1 hypothetical protein E2980_02860 [Cohnella luojiensis]